MLSYFKLATTALLVFISFSFTQDVTLTIDGTSLNYESTADIYGFQFDHDGCASGASGGDAGAAGFMISTSSGMVLGFSMSGGFIPAGNGTLLDFGGECSTISGLVFSGADGVQLTAELSSGDDDICAEHTSQGACEDVCCSWDEDSLTCADTDEGLPACTSTCIGYDDWPEVSCLEDICGFLEANAEDSECVETCDDEVFELFEFFAQMCFGSNEADHVVEVSNNVFTPDHLDIDVGETVEFINMGGFHNVDGSTDTYPDNPDSFYSGSASSDSWSYSFTFTVAGNYDYECNPHASGGMVGTIAVGSGGCTDDMACNYDAGADFDDGSCLQNDCAGECGGSAIDDECGVCGGDGAPMQDCWFDGDADGCFETLDPMMTCSCEWEGGSSTGGDCGSDTSNVDVLYCSDADIYGFQFAVNGVTVLGASGGAAEANGFTTTAGNNTVLGFSFSGTSIPGNTCDILTTLEVEGDASVTCLSDLVLAGDAGADLDATVENCLTISYVEAACDDVDEDGICDDVDDCVGEYDECGECNGDGIDEGACDCAGNVADCAGECGGSAIDDECGVCGGGGASVECEDGSLVCDASDCPAETTTVDVLYNSDADIYGFQFYVNSVTALSASGGAAADADFTVSVGNNTVLGFSFSGSFIPAGNGVLTTLEVEGDASAACLSDLVLSGANGTNLGDEITDCLTVSYSAPCDDVDEDGICDDVDDCVGEYDECGVCDGDGIAEGACDCDGNVADCAGECGGSAEVDECGVCGGDGNCGGDNSIELSFGAIADGTMEIIMNNTMPIAGFQFNVTGTDLDGAFGGRAADADFSVSTGDNGMVLGFSFAGAEIPAGSGVLTNLNYTALADQACLTNEIFALGDWGGGFYEINIGGCAALDFGSAGCTDESACNYDGDVESDDGSCYYDEAGCTDSVSGDCEAAGGVGGYTFAGCAEIATSDEFLASCEALGVGASIELACEGAGGSPTDCASLAYIYEAQFSGDCASAIADAISDGEYALCTLAGGIAEDTYSDCDDLAASGCAETCGDEIFTADVLYDSDSAISGFQFHVDGEVTVTNASGGDADAAGFTLSTANNNVLGFSMTGSSISAGSGILVNLEYTGDGSPCLSDVIVSDPDANGLDVTVVDCLTISYTAPCDDADADGICDDVDDCVGELDECGVCNGDSSSCADCAGVPNGDSWNSDCGCVAVDNSGDDCDDCTGTPNGDAVEDCAGECDGSTVEDECGVCGGDGSSCAPGVYGLALNDDGGLDVTFDSPDTLYGFQFYVSAVTVTGASGGAAAAAGFTTSTGNNTVLGFSFSGGFIPAGSGVLTVLSFEGSGEACLSDIVVSGYGGSSLDTASGDCATIEDCEDVDADGICDDVDDCVGELDECGICNGDGIADGACDCAGNVEDCAGECGGSAVEDECGECNGDGIDEGACDCDGNVEDCNGECGGSAEVDECGECGGDGIADGACDCAGNVEDCVGVCGGSAENCPDWEDNPGAYEFTATIAGAIVLYDGVQLGEDGDQLAALDSDGNVRGVGLQLNPPFGPYEGTTVYEVQLRSNSAGDLLHFLYYDASSDEVLDISETYEFVINDVVGDVIDPWTLNIQTTVDLGIDLIAGWNWISFNVNPEDASLASVLATVSETATFINSQSSGTATNYGAYGWYGGLTSLDPTQMYLLEMSEAATLTVTGVPVDVASTPISLIQGWNWIGYLPQNAGDVATALESVGDLATFINSQSSGTATNYGAYGWYGGLTTLEPGSGYLLEMSDAGELIYPEFSGTARLSENKREVVLSETISDWDFNYADYEFIGTIHASIESRIDFDGDVVAVFVDDECRGLAERMYFPFDDRFMYIIQAYSNIAEGEEMTFKYYDSARDEVVEYGETISFTSNMVVGDGFNTFSLSYEVNDLQPLAIGISEAYPNPFNPVTSFSYSIPEDGLVHVAVYDINGRMVSELVNGYQSAGTYPVVWDANELSSGVYMVNMIAGDYSTVQKVMLIK